MDVNWHVSLGSQKKSCQLEEERTIKVDLKAINQDT